jgi:hypothetical protein
VKPSERLLRFELMFDSKQTFSGRVVDAVDLVIDFATLGEYGLEPAERPTQPCEARGRSGAPRSTGSWDAAISRFAARA